MLAVVDMHSPLFRLEAFLIEKPASFTQGGQQLLVGVVAAGLPGVRLSLFASLFRGVAVAIKQRPQHGLVARLPGAQVGQALPQRRQESTGGVARRRRATAVAAAAAAAGEGACAGHTLCSSCNG